MVSEHVVLGPSADAAGRPVNPRDYAKDPATLDRLSGGRLVVLPTVSWHEDEYAALGVPFRQRGDILDEQLQIWAKA
jgi:alkanesulfonate monooxygenase SsuD/methylene tetrahydromethanopterin reductase-like flavin-dependent oxidoreductase (luciferase family)